MRLYSGIDLHANSSYLGILNEDNRIVFKRKLANDLRKILAVLEPFGRGRGGVDFQLVLVGGWADGSWLPGSFSESGGHSAI